MRYLLQMIQKVLNALLVQFKRQTVWVMEESHLLASVIIHTDWLTFNPDLCQLIHCLLHTLYTESKMTQTAGFRAVHTFRRIFLSENLQLCGFIDTKIQLTVLALQAVVFSDDREAQFVYIKILCSFVVRYDDCNMMYFL